MVHKNTVHDEGALEVQRPLAALPDGATTVLQQLRPRWRLADVHDIHLLVGGYSNDNYALTYRDADFVLRIVRASSTPNDRVFERRLLMGPVALLTAPLIAYGLPEGHMLSRRVAGPLLVQKPPGVVDLARYLARLHLRLPPLGRRYDLAAVIGRDLNSAAQRGEQAPRWIAKAHATLQAPALLIRPCHNDLNPWNVIVSATDPTRWCTLDWEFAGDNDPLFDLICIAEGLLWTNEQTDALIEAYLEFSESTRSPTTIQRRALRLAYFLREYAWALAQRASGNTRGEIEAQVSRNETNLRELTG